MSTDSPTRVLLLAPMRSELNPIIRLLSLKRSARGSTSVYSSSVYTGRAGRTEVIATTIGVGPVAARRTTERILSGLSTEGAADRAVDRVADRAVDHVIVCGIAGGVGRDRQIGSLVVPDLVVDGSTRAAFRPDILSGMSPNGTILTVGELVLGEGDLDRLAAEGIAALDMESAAVGEVCSRLGYRWSVFRSISDNAHEGSVDESVLGLLREDGSVDVGAAIRLILLHPRRLPGLVRLAKDSSIAARAAAKAAIGAISS